MADKEDSEKTIAEDLVVTKYKMAGEIVNRKEKALRAPVASDRAAADARTPPSRRGHMECARGPPMPGATGPRDHVPGPNTCASDLTIFRYAPNVRSDSLVRAVARARPSRSTCFRFLFLALDTRSIREGRAVSWTTYKIPER